MREMTGQFEESEEITVVEATYKLGIHRRQKYRCSCNASVVTAPGPSKLVPGGRYSVDFAVSSALAKYCDHLPWERQVRQMARPIQIAHCWAHVDRKFKEAEDPKARIAEIRGMIHQLYELEREIDGPFPGDGAAQGERLALRQSRAGPVIQEIREWAFAQGGLRRSRFGKAIRYMLKHWDGLALFLEDPRIPLDNNAAERVLRGVVVGRKNFYGNRSQRGAKVAVILYSLIETAKLRGLDPRAYLRQVALQAIERPAR